MDKTVRVAAVQDNPVLLNREATLDLVDELTDQAVQQGAQLAVFPEAFVPGPPVWIDVLAVGDDEEWHALLLEQSVTVPGPACDRLAAVARRAGVVLVIGVDERDEHGGTVYNSVLTFGPDGSLLGRHRKLMLGELHAARALSPLRAGPRDLAGADAVHGGPLGREHAAHRARRGLLRRRQRSGHARRLACGLAPRRRCCARAPTSTTAGCSTATR